VTAGITTARSSGSPARSRGSALPALQDGKALLTRRLAQVADQPDGQGTMIAMYSSGRKPLALIAGTIIVAVSIAVAFSIHEQRVFCSYLGGSPAPKCPQPADHLLLVRAGIIAGGLVIAFAIYFGSRVLVNRRRQPYGKDLGPWRRRGPVQACRRTIAVVPGGAPLDART
jgi:hypothetical protein